MLGRYCACEILIANTIDWLYAACLEYFIFSIDSSEARKQYDEYCLSIMQTITYAQKLNIYIYILYWYFQQSQCLNLKTVLVHFRSSIDRPLNLPQYLGSNNYFSVKEENI
jgi:hypothetical protein